MFKNTRNYIIANGLYNSQSLKIILRRKKFPQIDQKLKNPKEICDIELHKEKIEDVKEKVKLQILPRCQLVNYICKKFK